MVSHKELEGTVVSVLRETVRDWDVELDGGIGPETRLMADLQFESIDVVQFAVALEQALGRKGLPFEKLFVKDGNYVDDLSVTEVVAFLEDELQGARAASA